MSDTCIVCLGDLGSGGGEVTAPLISPAKSPLTDIEAAAVTNSTDARDAPKATTLTDKDADELIARLRPCGHYLHNECLTPWVERANSCPICRAIFNLVELMHTVDGDVISSYPVEDRTQVADLDPSMFLEAPEEEDEDQPCQACGEDDNEDVLMYCDGCQKLWHTYCVDLQEVPRGHWFCDNCRAQRQLDPRQVARSSRQNRRRTRGQQRRQRGNESSWNEVWQTVWSRINIDLDFPYEDDESSASYLRRHRQRNQANRQAHDAWLRRMQVAELHGAGNRFRETEPALPSSPGVESTPRIRRARESPRPVESESAEELLAWHAFDQARASSNEPSTIRKRKRKSATSSPAEPDSESTSASKRRRPSASSRAVSESHAPVVTRRRQPLRIASPVPRRQPVVDPTAPSFLQSLLQEVEDSSAHGLNIHRPSPLPAASPPADQGSPRPSSPGLSPLPSNHSSPRALSATPPPTGTIRPISPTGLSSSIQPIYAPTEYSPKRSISPEPKETTLSAPRLNGTRAPPPQPTSTPLAHPIPRSRVPRILENGHASVAQSRSTEASPTRRERTNTYSRSTDASPTRASLSLTAKEDVQKLVSTALKPHYHDQTITKDEYTTINRDVSRMLYDKIGDFETLDVDGRAKWEKVAGDEVTKAVNALKAQG
ncbi:hypothetical protein H2200_009605 [Cladophialophora chaetospira]|uniref:PHD and RING finger domain protein n=1 Tax=Cladophialophora chaetospira TaxID=386627 RepID=A0AA38X2R3_9EURO|nr:hypothetical protein H2200_009605 [Cladophialophora chaetospira]